MVISSSVAGLPAPARLLFAALGAFASDDIGREALLSVGRALGEPNPEASLDAILDLRLADAVLAPDLPAGIADRVRLRLTPLTHAFARDLLDAERTVGEDIAWSANERAAALRAMATWYARYANNANTPNEALTLDEANISGALAWAEAAKDDPLLTRLCNGMAAHWRLRGKTDDRKHYLPLAVAAAQRVAEATGQRDDRLRAAYLEEYHGDLLLLLGDVAAARASYTNSLQVYADAASQRQAGVTLSKLGDLALREGDVAAARAAYERFFAIMQAIGDQRGEGAALSLLGDLALRMGDVAAARATYKRYLAIMQAIGDQQQEGVALNLLGDLALRAGDVVAASATYERALAIMQVTGDQRGEGVALSALGDLALRADDIATARATYRRYLTLMQTLGDQREESVALSLLAGILEDQGELDEAEAHHRQSLEISRQAQHPRDEADALLELGQFLLRHECGEDEARALLAEAVAIYQRLGMAEEATEAQETMAQETMAREMDGGGKDGPWL